jgi:hypothetical protein
MRYSFIEGKSTPTANGPPLRCSRCNKLGHAASKCMELNNSSPSNVRTVLSCFNCGREGHVAKYCRRRPTHKASVGRGTDDEPGSAVRDPRGNAGVARDIEEFSGAPSKGWVRSGNDRRTLASNPSTARCLK